MVGTRARKPRGTRRGSGVQRAEGRLPTGSVPLLLGAPSLAAEAEREKEA